MDKEAKMDEVNWEWETYYTTKPRSCPYCKSLIEPNTHVVRVKKFLRGRDTAYIHPECMYHAMSVLYDTGEIELPDEIAAELRSIRSEQEILPFIR